MKTLALSFLSLLTLFAAQPVMAKAPKGFPDLPPDSSSSMYLSLGKEDALLMTAFDGLDNVVKLGERNLEWLNYINSFRPDGQKLSLTSKETQRGIPIDNPNEYNIPLIQQKLADLKPQIPAEMQKVIFENASFTKEPPVAIPDYLNWSRELDRVYQSALRWRMMAPYLSYLEGRRHGDLRGWYFLSRMADRAEKLRDFARLEESEKTKIRTWLVSMCFNEDYVDLNACARKVDEQISKGADLESYYQSKAPKGAELFKDHFEIPSYAPRNEIRFIDGDQPRLVAPFLDPEKDDVRAFLQDNIHDEWRFGNWRLELPFEKNNSSIPYVEFEPGVTPHVNGLGGQIITMNSQQPLTEYDAQWTIRHEYGHVLGFPDCYVEFYERERNVIVNYQIDIDNLMCSRRGHIQAIHVDELKRAYRR